MCCLITILLFIGPRAGIVFWWLLRPNHWRLAFDGFLFPLLGFLFVPWTTLMYVAIGFDGLFLAEWFLIGLAFLADVSMYVGGGYGNRDRIPG